LIAPINSPHLNSSENSPLKFSNNTRDDRNNYQVTFTFIENTGTYWRTLLQWWNLMNLHSFPSKTSCTNKFYMPKLSENSLFWFSNNIHDDRNSYQVFWILWKIQETHWRTLLWNIINLHSFSSKTNCTSKFFITKLSENSPFHVSSNTHNDRNNYQVTFIFIEIPGIWRALLWWWNMMNLHSFSLKTYWSNKFSIPKLSENCPFQSSDNTCDDRKNCQVTFIYMKNPGNLLKNTVMMKYDGLAFILIKKQIKSAHSPYWN